MTEYRKGRPEDAEEIIDFINLVFSHDHQPHDFPQLLPKLYKKENFHPEYHYLAVEDGRIRASIGSYPNTMVLAGQKLKCRDLGAVSVHPYARRAGHMRRLMDMLLADMEAEGTDISWLGGQRQRYGYWGYEATGCNSSFRINATNMRHVFPGRSTVWTLKEIGSEDPALKLCEEWHNQQPAHFEREHFYDVLCNWNSRPYGFYDQKGALKGYATMGKQGGEIGELILEDEADLDEALLCLIADRGDIGISVPSWRIDRARHLYTLHESVSYGQGEMCRIISFENVLKASLALSNAVRTVPDASFSFAVRETGETLRLIFKDGKGSVEKADKADIVWTRREAEACLFAPSPAMAGPAGLPDILRAVLPLPITPTGPDAV